MPLVKIELLEGNDPQFLFAIRDAVLDCVTGVLRLPPDDRNIRILEYEPGFFQMKSPYEVLIEITLFQGRTKETKKKLFESVCKVLENKPGISKEKIFIVLNEQPMENWGIRGGMPANEIEFDFTAKG
jgi:4-oxalocrotonate tautomerase family enzyme